MQVLHVLEALEGGTARHVQTLVEAQVAAGHTVAVVIPSVRVWGQTDTEMGRRLDALGVAVFPVEMHRFGPHPRNGRAALRLRRIIKRWRPAVVHTHSTAAGVIGRPVARSLRIPTVHTPNGVRFADVDATRVGSVAWAVERAMAPFTSRVIAASASEGDVLRRAYPAARIAVVPNGIAAGGPPPPLPATFRVVSVSRLVYQKAPELHVRVLAELRRLRPGVETILVGYGELEDETRRLIAALDPGIVISQQPGVEAIASASALLLASRWEGAPYVLLEAMDLARPVVATDVVGSRDTVAHGDTGLLFPWADAAAGAECLAALVDDPARAAAMGVAGRARLEREFSLATMADGVERVYAEVVGA